MSTNVAPSILLMWSGGISSTAALVKLLTSKEYSKYDIVVHHLHIKDVHQKAMAEAIACRNILEYVQDKKKYRKFYFSESNHEYNFISPPKYTRGVHDLDIVSFMAANICAGNASINHVLFGITKTDMESSESFPILMERSQRILTESLSLEEQPDDFSVVYPFITVTLDTVYKSLPRPIKSKVMSCSDPVYTDANTARHCCKCGKCNTRQVLCILT